MWFCELVWFIRGTVKEEHSVPPVDERCLFSIESGQYLVREQRGGKCMKMRTT